MIVSLCYRFKYYYFLIFYFYFSDSEDNSSDDENERASVDSQYSQELANLTSEINLKQKLIEELELSQRRLANLRQHYEDKLQQLQTKIKLTQDERDTVLSSLGN